MAWVTARLPIGIMMFWDYWVIKTFQILISNSLHIDLQA